MARIIAFILTFAVVLYGAWPYYGLYRLDQALSEPDAAAIAPFVDLPAMRAGYKAQLEAGVDRILPEDRSEGVPFLDGLAKGLRDLGGQAVDRIVSLDLVRAQLREAAIQATDKRPAYFLAGVDYAFFAGWNRFEVRLGSGGDATRVLMRLEGVDWRITDIRQSQASGTR